VVTMENQKTIRVAAIIGAAVLVAGTFAVMTTTPMTAYADRDYKKDKFDKKDKKDHDDYDGYDKDSSDVSKTITKQKLYQKNVGSGDSDNSNCGQNTIQSLAIGICPDASVFVDLDPKWNGMQ
jgi:hypothetical protein